MADRIDLSYFATKYPMPEGVRKLMPNQQFPFNGDGYAAAEVLRLQDKHDLEHAIETGTCYGSTTLFFATHFAYVDSFEIDRTSHEVACSRVGWPDVNLHLSDSVTGLMALNSKDRVFMFLDAHWNQHCPLLGELDAIAGKYKPVIMIHDFQVPDRPDLGFDRFPDTGNPFNLEAITPHLDKIYGADGWDHHYNDEAEGAKRGIIYIEPK